MNLIASPRSVGSVGISSSSWMIFLATYFGAFWAGFLICIEAERKYLEMIFLNISSDCKFSIYKIEMFKTHRTIYQRLRLENVYSVYIFSQFFLTFSLLTFMILDPGSEKGLFVEGATLIIGFFTYLDILIWMKSSRYYLKSLWGILETIIAILLTTILLNLLFRGFRLQT